MPNLRLIVFCQNIDFLLTSDADDDNFDDDFEDGDDDDICYLLSHQMMESQVDTCHFNVDSQLDNCVLPFKSSEILHFDDHDADDDHVHDDADDHDDDDCDI